MDEYAVVTDIVVEIVKEAPPLLHDQTSLARAANSEYGLTAQETLDASQELYEAGLISYPRTSSHYISPDMVDSVQALISGSQDVSNTLYMGVDISATRTEIIEKLASGGLIEGVAGDVSTQNIKPTELTRFFEQVLPDSLKSIELSAEIIINDAQKMVAEKYLPVISGHWSGVKGFSTWVPDDEKIPGKANADNLSWKEIKDKFNIQGIEFMRGEPIFSDIARGEVVVKDFTTTRYKNFSQADECEARRRGCAPSDVKRWRQENGYTWHELNDCRTMQKVPSLVHNNIVHSGGISEMKKQEKKTIHLEDWFK